MNRGQCHHCFFGLFPRIPCGIVVVVAGLSLLSATAAPAPRLEVPLTTYDFGWRDAAETVTNRFVLRNTGTADLHLRSIQTSCGCTRAEPASRVIAPGAETILEVHLALRGLQGQQRKTVSVLSNDPKTPNLTLWIQGEARAAVCLEPSAFSFGRLPPDTPPATAMIRLGGYLTTATITNAVSDNPAFPVSLGADGRSLLLAPPTLSTPGAHRATITVTLSCADRALLPVYTGWRFCASIHRFSPITNQEQRSPPDRHRNTAPPQFQITAVRGRRQQRASFERADGTVTYSACHQDQHSHPQTRSSSSQPARAPGMARPHPRSEMS